MPQTGVLRTIELYCFTALDVGSLKSGHRQDSPLPPASRRLQDRILHALLQLLATPGLPWLVSISPHHVVFSMSHCSILLLRTLPWDLGSTLIMEDGHISHISMCLPLITSPRPFWGSLLHLTSSRGHCVTPAFSCLVQPVPLAAAPPPPRIKLWARGPGWLSLLDQLLKVLSLWPQIQERKFHLSP